MSVGGVPDEWRRAIVTPVYKSGLAADVSNYRPISLTCVACKIMERVVVCQMMYYLREHRVISQEQYGFLAGRSTTLNLLDALNDWTLAIDNKCSVAAAYIDYAKAFDSVSPLKLCHKLKAYGIAGNLLSWIANLLSGRCQQTRVGSVLSEVGALISGVIQGSCLGPLLFVLYVNDIVNVFANGVMCKLYADDIKMYTVIKADIDCSTFQSNLDRLQQWSDRWQLRIAYKKCSILQIGNSSKFARDYFLEDNCISNVSTCKDLGIIIDQRLTFTSHINSIVTRAHARASLIHKCFLSRDRTTLTRAFCMYVRPMLEYACSVWSPHHIAYIRKIESVQRRFTKRFPGLAEYNYSSRLALLDLDSLELRRLRQDLILVYKIVFRLVDVNSNDYFKMNADSVTRGHVFKLLTSNCRVDARKWFFSQRIVNVWNSLPASAVNFASLAAFKTFITKTDLSTYLQCNV
jgi:ribonuclease P/MRP protein subunit RPP40